MAPTYASDMFVCDDADLRGLDELLRARLEQGRSLAVDSAGVESSVEWFRRSRRCASEPDQRSCLLSAYCLRLALLGPGPPGAANPLACKSTGPYIAAARFSRRGFAREGKAFDSLLNREVRVWGYVDARNLYGNDDRRRVLGSWWSGHASDAARWRFNLKADENDPAGQSFPVTVPNDLLSDDVLRVFVKDADRGRTTKVYLNGTISTFDAPTNAARLRGLRMDLRSSRDIHLDGTESP